MKKLSMINEHLWSGIIHRSETGETRKEDDVNLITDVEEWVEYLEEHYSGLYTITYQTEKKIELSLYYYDDDYYIREVIFCYIMNSNDCYIEYIKAKGNRKALYNDGYSENNLYSKEFIEKYDIHYKGENRYRYMRYNINKHMTNIDCIKFLDDYIKMCENGECEINNYCGISKRVGE